MFKIIFPEYKKQLYWKIHYQYLLNIFQYLKCHITYQKRPELIITINNKDFLFDYKDTSEIQKKDLPTFKFHCHQETDKLFAFPPVSFYDWKQYEWLNKVIHYNPNKCEIISCRQVPYGNATERRNMVQKILRKEFKNKTKFDIIRQIYYWKEINNIKIAIFIPGWCNNMIDRSHIQFMGLGVCTISPHLPEQLPFTHYFIPNVHYIECKDDYSDLIDILHNKQLEEHYIDIGLRAKQLFQETCTPKQIGECIKSKI